MVIYRKITRKKIGIGNQMPANKRKQNEKKSFFKGVNAMEHDENTDENRNEAIRLSDRIHYVKYAIRDVVDKAKRLEEQGVEMVWLNIGDPNVYGFTPPEHVIQAQEQAIQQMKKDGSYSSYAPSRGDPELVDAIVKYENITEEPLSEGERPQDRVFVVNGLSEGIDFLYQILVNPGENILLPLPAYPLYVTKQKVFSLESGANEKEPSVVLYQSLENGEPDLDDLSSKITEKTKAILVINPNNPVGTVYSRKSLEAIVDIAEEKHIPIISDDAYEMILLDKNSDSGYVNLRELIKGRDVVLISGGSVSKNYIYPGLRVGWLAIHGKNVKSLTDALVKMANQRLSINWIAQRTALAALQGPVDHIEQFKSDLRERRDYVMNRVNAIEGLSAVEPKGAFYAFIQVDNTKGRWKDDWDLVYKILDKGVVTVPGSGFGMPREGKVLYFRITFLPEVSTLKKAFDKIEEVLKG